MIIPSVISRQSYTTLSFLRFNPDLIKSVFFAHYARETLHHKVCVRGPENLAKLGRHSVLDNESETAIIASVLDPFQTGKS
jgi:hypothetical protein